MARAVFYTDLDATLLDHDTYGWAPARPALQALSERGIPLVFVTSKTLAETLAVREELHNRHPFVAENGALICMPRGYFQGLADTGEARGGLSVEYPGPHHKEVRARLAALRRDGFRFRGFSDMDDAEVAGLTGLDLAAAARARRREASEPLLWLDDASALARFEAALAAVGLQTRRGGRFLHVLGRRVDKGRALQRLHGHYQSQAGGGTMLAFALGDSPNDLDMLRVADVGVLVQRPDGTYAAAEAPPGLLHARGKGPAGWGEAVRRLLMEHGL